MTRVTSIVLVALTSIMRRTIMGPAARILFLLLISVDVVLIISLPVVGFMHMLSQSRSRLGYLLITSILIAVLSVVIIWIGRLAGIDIDPFS